jgi:ectoine hydroxylase-related dioxygenase (phytanoyl-CoA dioxygenase family)
MSVVRLNSEQIATFRRDGFVVAERLVDSAEVANLRVRIAALFAGEYQTGVMPDEVNWRAGRDPETATRQLCNSWKADSQLAVTVMRSDIGRACATLAGWRGARVNQDNLFWKPPGARAIGFHQDSAYEQWVVPDDMVSCWIALDDTSARGGTVEYVRGSHQWGPGRREVAFHAPDEPFVDAAQAARDAGVDNPQRVAIEVKAGDAVFHHGWVWHGSQTNLGDTMRRSLVVHCMADTAQFHPTSVGPIYSRYKRFNDLDMDESFFPITWREDGYRSPLVDAVLTRS